MEFFNFFTERLRDRPYHNCSSCKKSLTDTSLELCPDCCDKCINVLVSLIKNDKLEMSTRYLEWNISLEIWLEPVFNQVKDVENSSAYYYVGEYHQWKQNIGYDWDGMLALKYLFKSAKLGNKYAIAEIDRIKDECLEDFTGALFENFKERVDLEDKNQELEERIKALEMENTELKYRPDGIGYQTAKEHFESHLPKKIE